MCREHAILQKISELQFNLDLSMHHLYFALKALPCSKKRHVQASNIFCMKAQLTLETCISRLLYLDHLLRRSCIMKTLTLLLCAVNCISKFWCMLCTIAASFKGNNGLQVVLNKNLLYSQRSWAVGCIEEKHVVFPSYRLYCPCQGYCIFD